MPVLLLGRWEFASWRPSRAGGGCSLMVFIGLAEIGRMTQSSAGAEVGLCIDINYNCQYG